ncbi:MAG: cysteine desulfurase family protein [Candidatus Colwellbacteria bacterium]|nr:cysteine desulfurase family protein [Candidatus Colwellbacteria bacterium]
MTSKRIYLDHAATTPIDSRVKKAIDVKGDLLMNPSSIHRFGQEASAVLDEAREATSVAFGAGFQSAVFTSGATEANNLVLRGVVKAFYRSFRSDLMIPPRIVVSGIEHDSIIHTAKDLAEDGVEVAFIGANKKGVVSARDITAAINERTVLVSVMAVNNETGAIQPIEEIGRIISQSREEKKSPYPIFHTDVAQSFRYFNCNLNEINADVATVSGHKIGGPKGAGAVIIKPISGKYGFGKIIYPILTGGGQEFGMRSGTENVAGIFGFGEAIKIAEKERAKNKKKVSDIKFFFWKELKKYFPKAQINGAENLTAPHILNVWIPGNLSADIVMKCDLLGLAVSYGSACGAKSFKPSHALEAMGLSEKRIRESVRVSFSPANTLSEAKEGVRRIKKALI